MKCLYFREPEIKVFVLVNILLLLIVHLGKAQEFRINTFTTGNQAFPAIASLKSNNNGGFVVVWASFQQDGSFYGVYGQAYDTEGRALGSEFQINTYTELSQGNEAITGLQNGGFVVVWVSDQQDGSGFGVFGQVFEADRSTFGSEFQINEYTSNSQGSPAIAGLLNGNGGFVVVWASDVQDGSGWGVYGKIDAADGTINVSEFRINTETNGNQYYPTIAGLLKENGNENGEFVVVWVSEGQDGSMWGIYGKVYASNGTAIGSEFQINNYTNNDQGYPAVAALSNGGFVVVWESFGQDGSEEGIYGQVYRVTSGGSFFIANGSKSITTRATNKVLLQLQPYLMVGL